MPQAKVELIVAASLAETWEHYFDSRTWRSWVDGFEAVERADGYPESGGELVWRTRAAGRGRVEERVLEHEPRRHHRIAFTDPESEGELLTEMAIEGEGTRVTTTLDYRLRRRGPLGWLAGLFARSQVQRSLERTLARFAADVEEGA